jgi:hypothetical protein
VGCELQKETGGEERVFVNPTKIDAVSVFFKKKKKSKKGIFVTLNTQNDVVLNFSSIFMVSTNGRGHFIRSW